MSAARDEADRLRGLAEDVALVTGCDVTDIKVVPTGVTRTTRNERRCQWFIVLLCASRAGHSWSVCWYVLAAVWAIFTIVDMVAARRYGNAS